MPVHSNSDESERSGQHDCDGVDDDCKGCTDEDPDWRTEPP